MKFIYTKMNQNKNVLVTATTFPRYKNDIQPSFIKDLSQELAKNGLNVHVLVPHDYGLKYYEEVDSLKIHRFTYFYPRKLQKLAYGGLIPNIKKNKLLIFQAPFLFLFQLLELFKLIRKYNINVVHSHWLLPQGLNGALLKKFFNIKHVLTIHGADLFVLLRMPLGRKLAIFILKNTDHIACLNKEIQDNVIKLIDAKSSNKVSVISMGVNVNEFRDKFKFNRKILFLGRLADKKGVKYLLEAIKLLKDKDIRVFIAGDGPLRRELENFVKLNKLQNKVKFLGFISGKDKINLIKDCCIFVAPSIITNYGDREGLPVSLLEAMAASKAIIATDVGGIKDAIKNNYNGLLIKQKSSNEIVNAINKLISNKNLAKKLAMNSRRTVLNYDWKIIGKKYYNVLMKR